MLESEVFQTLKVFLIPILIVVTLLFFNENKAEKKRKLLQPFQVTNKLLSIAKKKSIFMHCLPAHRGEEVTDGVIDSPNSIVLDQAENRMWAQMSLLTYMCNHDAWLSFHELK